MAKRIISQNRGRGGPTYRAPSHRYKAELRHLALSDDTVTGVVIGIEHDPARSAPIAKISFDNGEERLVLVQEGVAVGEIIECGISAEIKPGNTLPLAEIPEGVPVCNIESIPGNGGQFARASGTYATIFSHDAKKTMIQLPSGEIKALNPRCRATIGMVAGGGRVDKPFVRAGNKFYKMRTRAQKWPHVKGVCMNSIDHPYGNSHRQHPGKSKSVSRNAPPGRKVGSIASKRTGRK